MYVTIIVIPITKKGEMIFGEGIPYIVNTNSIRFVEIIKNKKKVTTCMVFKPKSFQPCKSC